MTDGANEREIEKLWTKINETKSNLAKLQEQQDKNVSIYLEGTFYGAQFVDLIGKKIVGLKKVGLIFSRSKF